MVTIRLTDAEESVRSRRIGEADAAPTSSAKFAEAPRVSLESVERQRLERLDPSYTAEQMLDLAS